MKEYYDHSDTGNAELLADLYGENVRYDNTSQRWFQWDKACHYWQELLEPEIRQMTIKTANYRAVKAVNMSGDEAKAEFSFAVSSRNLNRQNAMLTISRALSPIGNRIVWDDNPELLAVTNGVINLRTGILRVGQKTDYLTRGLSIPYIPTSDCPRWEQFIDEITCGNRETAKFLQRAIGYTLTGFTREQVFFLLHGSGSNGKSVLLDTLERLMEGFSKPVRFATFEENSIGDARRDLAELPGVRAAFASEGSSKKVIDTAIIKQVTGSDPITTSRKYGHPFTYRPQFKLWLMTNNLPRVDDDSYGFWRRLVIIPFEAKFEGANKDKYLEEKLKSELTGILAWAVEGSKIWFEQHLSTPDHLLLRVVSYRDSQDDIEGFINEVLVRKPGNTVKANVLYSFYAEWCNSTGRTPKSVRHFGEKISERLTKKRGNEGWLYIDIDVKLASGE